MNIKIRLVFSLLIVINCLIVFQLSGQDTIRILPLGNSITSGYTDGSLTIGQRRAYRYGLKFLLSSHGFITDFVGTESSGCDFFSDCQHAGFGGTYDQYLLQMLEDGWITYYTSGGWTSKQTISPPGPYLDYVNPDIILLHIGTNDISNEGDAALTNQKITDILDIVDEYEVRANKEVIVFVALIINRVKPWGTKAYQTSAFNDGIETLVQSRISSGDDVVIVDMENYAGFEYSYDVDMSMDGEGLHPNATGYSKMASLWYSSIENNYNTAPTISDIPNQEFDEGTSSGTITLDDYVSDIQDPDEDITWNVEQLETTYLDITINTSRQAVATPVNPEWSGIQTVVFTATDLGKNGKYIKSSTDTVDFIITPVSALNEVETADISIYPVPAHGYLMVKSDQLYKENVIEVITLSGTIVKKISLPDEKINYKLDLNGYKSGIYFLRLVNKTTTYIRKFSVIN